MTGTIVGLAATARTGTIRMQDGSRLAFSAASVLGDFDALAVGNKVNFDLDRPRGVAVGIFREPLSAAPGRKSVDGPPDVRYAGFTQTANIRAYLFEVVAPGRPARQFAVTVDLALMVKHRITVQEAPGLCLRKLTEDLKNSLGPGQHQLCDRDLLEFVSSRATAPARKRPRHPFSARPAGSPDRRIS